MKSVAPGLQSTDGLSLTCHLCAPHYRPQQEPRVRSGLAESANKHAGLPVTSEFQINNKLFLNISMSLAIFGTCFC